MRLESAMLTSSTGLAAHSQAIAVIGDNISNSNTVAFKTSQVKFSDLLAEGPEARQSTANPPSGSGVQVDQITQDHATGVIEFTGRSLDTAIAGAGFYSVGEVATPQYTRSGNFIIDGDGLLATSAGDTVLGYTGTGNTLGTIDMLNLDLTGTPTSNIDISGNLNSADDIATNIPTNPATFREIGQEANFITTVTAYDSLGVGHEVTLAFFKEATSNWVTQAYIDGDEVGGTEGVPVQLGANATLTFDTNGQISDENAAAASITATPAYNNGSEAGNFVVDLSNFSQFGGNTVISSITQDGEGTGDVKDYEFRSDGSIMALLSSGTEVLIGRLPIANFNNPEGLARSGNGLYAETERSGEVNLGTAGASGFGSVDGSSLERSNVDLGEQFVELVVIQRGYQANSQIMSQASEMVRNTINLMN